jgi:hypothetical protein
LETEKGRDLFKTYEEIISMLVAMTTNADSWVLNKYNIYMARCCIF